MTELEKDLNWTERLLEPSRICYMIDCTQAHQVIFIVKQKLDISAQQLLCVNYNIITHVYILFVCMHYCIYVCM